MKVLDFICLSPTLSQQPLKFTEHVYYKSNFPYHSYLVPMACFAEGESLSEF